MALPCRGTDLPIVEVLADAPGGAAPSAGRAPSSSAPPGAGKTTVVPLALLDEPWLGDAAHRRARAPPAGDHGPRPGGWPT